MNEREREESEGGREGGMKEGRKEGRKKLFRVSSQMWVFKKQIKSF